MLDHKNYGVSVKLPWSATPPRGKYGMNMGTSANIGILTQSQLSIARLKSLLVTDSFIGSTVFVHLAFVLLSVEVSITSYTVNTGICLE